MAGAGRALVRSGPSAEGVAGDGIAGFVDAVAARNLQVHSLMVLRHGRVVAEGWWRPYGPHLPHMLFSLSKSFASTAVGLAVAEGRLSVTDPVVSFFPEDLPAQIGPNLATMEVRHLLMMGTGHAQDTTGRLGGGEGTWVQRFLRLPVEHAPGSLFVYNSGATYMLSAIVQKLTGLPLVEYLEPRLFAPLGMVGATWTSSPEGINFGGWGLSLTTEDIARLGQLYLCRGRWNGVQVVPEAWVDEATRLQIHNGNAPDSDWAQGYGYQFWRCRHNVYRGDGAHGQFCIVMPEKDAVVAITSGTDNLQGILNAVWEHILPGLDGGAPDQDARLRDRLESLTLAPAGGGGPVPALLALSGRRHALEDNPARLEAVTLDLDGDRCRLTLVQGGRTHEIDCGFGTWRTAQVPFRGPAEPEPCAGYACWEPDGGLRLDWAFVRTPFSRTLRLTPADGGGLALRYGTNVGEHAKGLDVGGTGV